MRKARNPRLLNRGSNRFTNPTIIGIDPSMRGTGIAMYDRQHRYHDPVTIKPREKLGRGLKRLDWNR